MSTPEPVESTNRSMSVRTQALSMILGLVIGMAALVVAIVLLETNESDQANGKDKRNAETPAADAAERDPTTTATTGWPAAVEFRPAALGAPGTPPEDVANVEPGLYLWSDFEGWHLWSVGTGSTPVSGSVVINGEFGSTADEGGAASVEKVSGDRIDFQLGANGVAGIRFHPGFFTDRLEIRVDAPPPLFLGRDETAATLPVVIQKNEPVRTLDED